MPPEPAPRRPRRARLIAGAAALAALAALAPVVVAGGRWTAAWVPRRLTRAPEALLERPVLSQVGYAPRARKAFTAGVPFQAFSVVDATTGAPALRGGPGREVRSDVLGPGGRAFVGDLSALTAPGRYRVLVEGLPPGDPFDVGERTFDGPVRAVQRSFYFQRAFAPVEASHAEGPWTHPSDAHRAPPGVRGGWHDAGDYSVYSASLNGALHWLLAAWLDFAPRDDDTGLPESGNGVPDLLDEARVGLEWILSTQDAAGGFANTTCLERYGPYGANPPEEGPPYRAGEVGTLATGRAVASLATAAQAFREVDPAFAARCLAAAWRGVAYLDAHPGESTDGPTCPAARRDGDARVGAGVRRWAAAGMLLATGDARFARAFAEVYEDPPDPPAFLDPTPHAARLYLRAPAGDPALKARILAALARHAGGARAEAAAHPFAWAGRYHWGSIGAAFARLALTAAPRCVADPAGAADDCEVVLDAVHYALGRNAPGFCYLSGLPGVTRGLQGGFHHWLATLRATPRDYPGLLAGGPNATPEPGDRSYPRVRPVPLWGYAGDPAHPRGPETPLEARHTDNDSFSTNEPSIEQQASALYALHLARWLARGGPAGALSAGPVPSRGAAPPPGPVAPGRPRTDP